MIKIIDPTYIRTIYDGLNSGLLHKDNNSDLPIGLVGMYEAAIPTASSVNERKRFLDFFTVWALLKKEVSLEFILPLLEGWVEGQLLDYIAQYSKWFNSPVSGKYQLYHERLRVFVIQKISHKQFAACNDIIIKQCQNALQLQNGSEWERYALEHLSKHLLIAAMENRDDSALKSFSYNTTHWNRQIKISKGFEWSKHMLNDMMLWSSKYSEDEVIECALNKVDLHHLEQNDAPRIVELIALNEIDTALQRLETYSANDKEGLQRKFILYMLCLMELTLLESKDKPFSKDAIEKLLKHLDDNLPVDHSLLNWNDFFPSYVIFQIATELLNLGLNYDTLFIRTKEIDIEWIEFNGPYNKFEYQIIENILSKPQKRDVNTNMEASKQEEQYLKCSKYLLGQYAIKNRITLINSFLSKINDDEIKSELLEFIVKKFVKLEKLNKALRIIDCITELIERDRLLSEVVKLLIMKGNIDEANAVLSQIKHKFYRVVAYCIISEYFYDKGDKEFLVSLNIALKISNSIRGFSWLLMSKRRIALLYIRQGKLTRSIAIIKDTFLPNQKSDVIKDFLLLDLVQKISEKRKFEFAIEIAEKICNDNYKKIAYSKISKELFKRGKSVLEIKGFLNLDSKYFNNINELFPFIKKAAIEFIDSGKLSQAKKIIKNIKSNQTKCDIYIHFADYYFKNKNDNQGARFVQLALDCSTAIGSLERHSGIKDIISLLLSYSKFDDSLLLLKLIKDDFWSKKSEIEADIVLYLGKNGYTLDALNFALKIEDSKYRNIGLKNLLNISKNLIKGDEYNKIFYKILKLKNQDVSSSFISEQLEKNCNEFIKLSKLHEANCCAKGIKSIKQKTTSLLNVSSAFYRAGNNGFDSIYLEALALANQIDNEWDKNEVFKKLSIERNIQGHFDEAYSLLTDSLKLVRIMEWPWNFLALHELYGEFFKYEKMDVIIDYAREIIEESFDDSGAYQDIAIEWVRKGNLKEGLSFVENIDSVESKAEALALISTELYKLKEYELSKNIMADAYNYLRKINTEPEKFDKLESIYIELNKQNAFKQANEIFKTLIETAFKIDDDKKRRSSIKFISIELAKQGKLGEAIELLSDLALFKEMNDGYLEISTNLAKQGDWLNAIKIAKNISEITLRQACWGRMAFNSMSEKGWQQSLLNFDNLDNNEAKKSYLNGISASVSSIDCNRDLVLKMRILCRDDIQSLEKILQQHALHEIFFNDPTKGEIERFKYTFNIQWAIDIKNSIIIN